MPHTSTRHIPRYSWVPHPSHITWRFQIPDHGVYTTHATCLPIPQHGLQIVLSTTCELCSPDTLAPFTVVLISTVHFHPWSTEWGDKTFGSKPHQTVRRRRNKRPLLNISLALRNNSGYLTCHGARNYEQIIENAYILRVMKLRRMSLHYLKPSSCTVL